MTQIVKGIGFDAIVIAVAYHNAHVRGITNGTVGDGRAHVRYQNTRRIRAFPGTKAMDAGVVDAIVGHRQCPTVTTLYPHSTTGAVGNGHIVHERCRGTVGELHRPITSHVGHAPSRQPDPRGIGHHDGRASCDTPMHVTNRHVRGVGHAQQGWCRGQDPGGGGSLGQAAAAVGGTMILEEEQWRNHVETVRPAIEVIFARCVQGRQGIDNGVPRVNTKSVVRRRRDIVVNVVIAVDGGHLDVIIGPIVRPVAV